MDLAGGSGGGGSVVGNGVGGESQLQSADLLSGRHAVDLRPDHLRQVRSSGRGWIGFRASGRADGPRARRARGVRSALPAALAPPARFRQALPVRRGSRRRRAGGAPSDLPTGERVRSRSRRSLLGPGYRGVAGADTQDESASPARGSRGSAAGTGRFGSLARGAGGGGRAHRGPGTGPGRIAAGRRRHAPRLRPRRAPGLARGHFSQARGARVEPPASALEDSP